MSAKALGLRVSEERWFYALVIAGGLVLLAGIAAAHYMDVNGHVVTGMNNQVVWGLPHVFAIFMIVAASGALNVASVGSVFGETAYKPHARLSALLCFALLAGGLMVLLLDLGRPERVIVAATHYNLTSVFAWNVILYSGMFGLVAAYLWTLTERRMQAFSRPVGVAALVWRFVLTTGTGSIFGFLVARQAYQSALLAPLFIVLSLAWGQAVFLLAQAALHAWHGRALPQEVTQRMARLLALFTVGALYLVVVYHVTNLYFARQTAFEAFILLGRGGGAGYASLFWLGYVVLGTALPLALLWRKPGTRAILAASALVCLGAFAWLYVFIVGGQAFPLEIFPGHVVSSTFFDGAVDAYRPSWPEWLLGLGGLAAAFVAAVVGVRVLEIAPAPQQETTTAKP